MTASDAARKRRFHRVVAMFLDGSADRYSGDAPMRRYAHVFKGSLTVCVTDEDTADFAALSGVYGSDWKWLGTIDLDDGELVASSGETAIGRVTV